MFNKGDKVRFLKTSAFGKAKWLFGEVMSQNGEKLVVEYQEGSRKKMVIVHQSRVQEVVE
jgi:hypothetical protein